LFSTIHDILYALSLFHPLSVTSTLCTELTFYDKRNQTDVIRYSYVSILVRTTTEELRCIINFRVFFYVLAIMKETRDCTVLHTVNICAKTLLVGAVIGKSSKVRKTACICDIGIFGQTSDKNTIIKAPMLLFISYSNKSHNFTTQQSST